MRFVDLFGDTNNLKLNELYFKFVQEYEPNAGNMQLNYNIYNWDRTNAQSGSFPVSYGVNWVKIPLTLTGAHYYNLEIVGNKGEKYFLNGEFVMCNTFIIFLYY